MNVLDDLLIEPDETVKSALKMLDKGSEKVLFVVDKNRKLLGTLSDGDIRRALLKGVGLEAVISDAYNRRPKHMHMRDYSLEVAKRLLIEYVINAIPIVDDDDRLVDYVSWEQAFSSSPGAQQRKRELDLPVVIMAGGRGTRLAPFTNVLPKPLIPIKDRTILEVIISGFLDYRIKHFYISVNYRAQMIRAYLDSIEKEYTVSYIEEKDFYGTAGSLKLVESEIADTFIVTNCDIITRADYADVVDHHRQREAVLTVIASIQHVTIPYGVVEYANGGDIVKITEKPEYSLPINTGVYVMDRQCLDLIPRDAVFNMTDVIEALLRQRKRVATYIINENDYIDVGQWEEYTRVMRALSAYE
jgi:dTDP-glucose pyrophosphorylase